MKAAFRRFSWIEEITWLTMLSARNNMAHIYDGEASAERGQEIITCFIPAFQRMERYALEQYGEELKKL